MHAWIHRITEIAGIENMRIDISLSSLKMLVPDARWLLVVGPIVAFCIVAACQDAWFGGSQDRHCDKR